MKVRGALVAVIVALCLPAGSSPGEATTVPDVVGADVQSAYNELRRAGLAVRTDEPFTVTPSHSPSVDQQSIAAGEEARLGTTVSLEVSPAGHGLLPPGPPTVAMPGLIGTPLNNAVRTLETLNLNWAAAPLPPLPPTTKPSLLDNYEVTAQKPRPGTRFVQTVSKRTSYGIATKTTPVWLRADLRTK